MEAVCGRGDAPCEVAALTAALHALHLYCAALAAALIVCCAPKSPEWYGRVSWRGQCARGVASLALLGVWALGAAAALLRASARAPLAAALLAPAGGLAAAALHVALWSRRAAAPLLYLALYHLLSAAAAAARLYQHLHAGLDVQAIDFHIQALSVIFAGTVALVDCICFYDEVTKSFYKNCKSSAAPTQSANNVTYEHCDAHFYSKITFFWLNPLLYRGYETPLESDDLGELPEKERSSKHYHKFNKIYKDQVISKDELKDKQSLLRCYIRMVWPNFYLAGILKLFSDVMGLVPPLGLAVIIDYIEGPPAQIDAAVPVTVSEFFNNGYVMLLILTLALIAQALLSQNSTHLVTVEGTRLKTALQGMIYDKCMRLAPWAASMNDVDEESPLLSSTQSAQVQLGLLTNLVSQDTYNIMSCVWICHYTWAIPLKVSAILYLLYTKLGVSAIIGTVASIVLITPLQFYIGKKISDNSKEIAKCSDHRISKMTEILQGINVIKLYVWEDLFNEKILNLRELELKHLNKDTIHWNLLTFTTQASTILVTFITFTAYVFMHTSEGLTAVNVFAGLALFNQLTVPLLILPVTVLMIIQATVSSKRIKEFLDLPESNNVQEDEDDGAGDQKQKTNVFNEAFIDNRPEDDDSLTETDKIDNQVANNLASDNDSDDEVLSPATDDNQPLVKFQNALFSWGIRNDNSQIEVDDLDIPPGKLIMVVGGTGSGKSSLLSAILSEMYLERGSVTWNRGRSTWYAGQPPWLLEGSVRDNIVMGGSWCQRRYARVLRATGLRPDLQLLPEGDATVLGSRGTPLSGGQRVRVGVARALYSRASLVALDEPLGALDAALARHVVARALVPAARSGRTVLLATNRLELMHYADLILVMEEGRVSAFGRPGGTSGLLARWSRLAAEARAGAARGAGGGGGGAARERTRLVRALSRATIQRRIAQDVSVGSCSVAGAHLLTEVAVCGGSWRVAPPRRPPLCRQLSSPPPANKVRRDVRRVVSADASSALQRQASCVRRLLRPRPLARWTPRPLRRLLSSDSDTVPEDQDHQENGRTDESAMETTYTSITSNGVETAPVATDSVSDKEPARHVDNECSVWLCYIRACGWWGAGGAAAAAGAQLLAVAADCWLAYITTENAKRDVTREQMWQWMSGYAFWCGGGLFLAGLARAAGGAAGGAARRALHERLLHATLHAPLAHHHATPVGHTLHRFSHDVHVVDSKLPTAVTRWAQLALTCLAAALVSVAAAPWSLLALAPAAALYLTLQSIYLRNARELQCAEARSAAPIVSLAGETGAGGATIRAARLQRQLRTNFLTKLDDNHNALLLLNAANRWLGLTMDLVGAAAVCVSLAVSSWCGGGGGAGGALAGLAGAHALLLPLYLAHLAKCRADLALHLAAVERLVADTNVPQEDYRDDCPIPAGWKRDGRISFEDVSVTHEPGAAPALARVRLTAQPGEKVAICGRSGSGKSTLLMSCVGATSISRGRVLIDGQDATLVPLRALRHRLVVLPQEATLFSTTLRENLDPLGVHTDMEIWTCLRVVGLYEFVAAQSAGLECMVPSTGGGGGAWSAGRRARACAARAVLRAPLAAALLLDEPGAALDAPAEQALLAAVARAAPNTTLLTVAHRMSSVSGYDRCVLVERGSATEQGAPARLPRQATRDS